MKIDWDNDAVQMPFSYPMAPHVRLHGPSGYEDYTTFKDWLRDEFSFRCVYCLSRERWYPNGSDAFGVDHLKPKATHPELECDYDNLVYACNRCNSAKGVLDAVDPTAAPLGRDLHVQPDGSIVAKTLEGRDLIALLHLNDSDLVECRRHFLRIVGLYARSPDDLEICLLYTTAFSYPNDLPNLASKKPLSNSRPDGIAKSCQTRSLKGQLPVIYALGDDQEVKG